MKTDLFSHIDYNTLAEEFFEAYYSCRKNKRNTHNALQYEVHLEKALFSLIDDVYNGVYTPGRSIAFIVNKPVKREIFAADFRDRIVHHWLINKLNPFFEKLFIPDSYACREGKGTHFGIRRVNQFIKECSENYTKECFVLKLDIQGFFMHIHRGVLVKLLKHYVYANYTHSDINLVLELLEKIIFNSPTERCTMKGSKNDWKGLPKNKSLFHSPKNCGLPIGNLTSQVFANFYMHQFDEFVKKELGIKYYGRYVDDFVLIHSDKEFLRTLTPTLSKFLFSTLQLTLHPNKIYLQHYSKGVKFLGAIIKPNRIYIANRTKGNLYQALMRFNEQIKVQAISEVELTTYVSTVNSYLGIMKHFRTYRLRSSMLRRRIGGRWHQHIFVSSDKLKIVKRVRKNYSNRTPLFVHYGRR